MKVLHKIRYVDLVWWGLLALLLAPASTLWAQDPALRRANAARAPICPHTTPEMYVIEEFYSLGQFDSIAHRQNCLQALFDQTRPALDPTVELQSVAERFMYLYALCNIHLYHYDDALEATTMLLQRFPEHKFDPVNDPPQFQSLMDSLVPYHAHHLGVFVGGSLGLFNGSDPVTVRDDITPGGAVIKGPKLMKMPRLIVGFEWQYHISYRHSLITGIGLESLAYRTYYASRDFATPHQVGDWELKIDDSQSYLQIPLAYEYRIPIHQSDRKHRAFLCLSGGFYGGFLIHALSTLHSSAWMAGVSATDSIVNVERDFTLGNLRTRRADFTGGAIGAVTYFSQVGHVNFFLRLGAQLSFKQLQSVGAGLSSDYVDYIWSYHVGDQGRFKLHGINVTMGVLLPRHNRVKNIHRP